MVPALTLVDGIYSKYEQFSEENKVLFRQLLVTQGTNALVSGFTDSSCDLSVSVALLLVTIELRDALPTVDFIEDYCKLTTRRMPIIGELITCPGH